MFVSLVINSRRFPLGAWVQVKALSADFWGLALGFCKAILLLAKVWVVVAQDKFQESISI